MQRLTPHPTVDNAALVALPARLPVFAHHAQQTCDLTDETIRAALAEAARLDQPLTDVLHRQFGCARRDLLRALCRLTGADAIDPNKTPCDVRILHQYGVSRALRHGVLPWRAVGGSVVILVTHPDQFARRRAALEMTFGPVRMALTTEDQMNRAIARNNAHHLIHRAEARVEAWQSCRSLSPRLILVTFTMVGATVLLSALLAPLTTLATLTAITVVTLFLGAALKGAAALVSAITPRVPEQPPPDTLPVITVLVPLYRERAIAEHLLARLAAIDYPRELLDVCLVLEEDDATTREALGQISLLKWVRAFAVPAGTIKTKPRAMNYVLDFARGSIVGVYDAEDAPAPDQLRKVAAHFAQANEKVACLQGTLDYYNSRANWLTRCFTIEYAGWFRVILPGLAQMGLVVPLGGTTLFFRRDVLDQLGAWDAHNVTEDADLGIRLARQGYRTEFIPTVTQEEANGRFWPWVKQRSRWLKGYAVTYWVHMRNPVTLWRDLGAWRFFGLNVLFAGTLVQFLLAPLMWSFWLVPLGVPHPIAAALPAWVFWGMVVLFVLTETINLTISWLGLKHAGKPGLWAWAFSLQLYFPLGTAAVYKGMLELAWKPFYWDKTDHGLLMPTVTPPPEPSPHQVSSG